MNRSEFPIERLESMNDYARNGLIYHFTSLYPALEYILFKKSIRFSRFDRLNDPKESRPIFQFGGQTHGKNIDSRIMLDLYNRFLTFTKLICFSIDNEKYFKHRNETNPYPGKGFNHPRMWAQYSDNHRGICLVFDSEKLEKNLAEIRSKSTIFRGKVSYSEKYLEAFQDGENPYKVDIKILQSIGIDKYYYKHLRANKRIYYFSKHSDWKDENEYRIVVLDDNDDDIYLDISDSIIAVIAGSDFPKCYTESLISLCKILKIDAFKIAWDKGFARSLNLLFEH